MAKSFAAGRREHLLLRRSERGRGNSRRLVSVQAAHFSLEGGELGGCRIVSLRQIANRFSKAGDSLFERWKRMVRRVSLICGIQEREGAPQELTQFRLTRF